MINRFDFIIKAVSTLVVGMAFSLCACHMAIRETYEVKKDTYEDKADIYEDKVDAYEDKVDIYEDKKDAYEDKVDTHEDLRDIHTDMEIKAPYEEEAVPVIQDDFDLGEMEYESGEYDKAIERYCSYLKINPGGEKARDSIYRIASINYYNRLYEEALIGLEEIVEKYPEHAETAVVKYDIANIHYRKGDYYKSHSEALQWIGSYPSHPLRGEVLFLVGKNYSILEENSGAFLYFIQAFDAVLEGFGQPDRLTDIEDQIIGLLKRCSFEELKKILEYGVESNFLPHIYHRMAVISLDQDRPEEAEKYTMALIRSTREQYWVSVGKGLFDRIFKKIGVSKHPKKGIIGCMIPLSGPFALYGQELLNGIELGMDIFSNSDDGLKLELIIRDTGGKEDIATAAVDDLVNNENVIAIIGPLASRPAMAASRRAQELGVPIITLTQKAGITDEGDMVFRNFLTPEKEVQVLLDETITESGLTRFAIFYPDNSYGNFLMNLFWDKAEELGGHIMAVEAYDPGATDFKDEVKKLVGLYYPRPESITRMLNDRKAAEAALILAESGVSGIITDEDVVAFAETISDPEERLEYLMGLLEAERNFLEPESDPLIPESGVSNPEIDEPEEEEEELEPIVDFDAIFIPDKYQQIALIAPQFPFYNIFDVRLLGTSAWKSSDLIETSGDYVRDAIFPCNFFSESSDENIRSFVTSYQYNFEAKPSILAASGYDTIKFIKGLLNEQEIRTRRDFQMGLFQFDMPDGVTGAISFDIQGEVEKDPYLLTISGRRFRLLKEIRGDSKKRPEADLPAVTASEEAGAQEEEAAEEAVVIDSLSEPATVEDQQVI